MNSSWNEMWEHIDKYIINQLELWGEYTVDMFKKNITPIVSSKSELFNVKSNIDIIGDRYTIVFYLPDYFPYFENGRGPGKMPPVPKIEDWIINKPIPIVNKKNVPSTKQVAFAIAKHIAKHGTEGHHTLEETINSAEVKEFYNKTIDNISNFICKEIAEYCKTDLLQSLC